MEHLFSYGTLQEEKVQLDTFGRILNGTPEILLGYRMDFVAIEDVSVVESSGKTHHPILHFSGNTKDEIKGMLFEITEVEMNNADIYEAEQYKRIKGALKSGKKAWVYVAK
jgi:gamma-glutamylcyclotransferase (GGCT)/AIG2-like uncharacterized protein YtfP